MSCSYYRNNAGFVAAAILLFLGFLGTGTALAQPGPGSPAGFEIDGNLVSESGGLDWFNNGALNGSGIIFRSDEPDACQPNPVFLPAVFERDNVWASKQVDESAFDGGSNKNSDCILAPPGDAWQVDPGGGPQKNDLTEVFAHSRVDVSGNLWLFLGAATRSTNGDSHLDFEYNRHGLIEAPNTGGGGFAGYLYGGPGTEGSCGRADGDRIISIDFENGGAQPMINIRRWNGTTNQYELETLPADAVYAAVNVVSPAEAPCGATEASSKFAIVGEYAPLQFVEAALNLSAIGIPIAELCAGSATLTPKTRSSSSFTAELKDYRVIPFSIVEPPNCSIDGPMPVCQAETDLVYTASCDGSIASYDWQISGEGIIASGQGTPSVTVNAGGPGSFTLTLNVVSVDGCEGVSEKTVSVSENPSVVVGDAEVCAGTAGQLTAVVTGGVPPYGYSWTGPGEFVGSGQIIDALEQGEYFVTVTDAAGCMGSGSGFLTVNANPEVVIEGDTETCEDVATQFTAVASMGTPPYSFSWTGPGGYSAIGETIDVSVAGEYCVTVTDANSCSGGNCVTLDVMPAVSVTVENAEVCEGLTTQLYASVSGGTPDFTYSWSGPGGFAASTALIDVSADGDYHVAVTDSKGCMAEGMGTLNVNPAISVLVEGGETCDGYEGQLTAVVDGGTPPMNITWTGPGGFTGSGETINPMIEGEYCVTVVDSKGCEAGTCADLSVNPALSVNVAGAEACEGESVELVAEVNGGTPPYIYSWTGPEDFTAETEKINVEVGGEYCVTVVDSKQCEGSGCGEFNAIPGPPACIILGPELVCPAETHTYTVDVPPTPGLTYKWTAGDRCEIIGPADGPSVEVAFNRPGSCAIHVELELNGCVSECQFDFRIGVCRGNCPRTAGFWAQQCDQKDNGSTKFTEDEVAAIAGCVDERVEIFDWEFDPFGGFCITITPEKPENQRLQAKRQFATALANTCAGEWGFVTSNGEFVYLDPETPVSCDGLNSTTYGALIEEVDAILLDLEGESLDDPQVKSLYSDIIYCLDALNNGEGIELDPECAEDIEIVQEVPGSYRLDPYGFRVQPPLPNPFRRQTVFPYSVPGNQGGVEQQIALRIYNVAGRLVRTLVNDSQAPGEYRVSWDGRDDSGQMAARGVYFVRASLNGQRVNSVTRVLYLR